VSSLMFDKKKSRSASDCYRTGFRFLIISKALMSATAFLILTMMFAPASQAGQVRIEGDQIRISIGEMEGYGVMAALSRHNLLNATRGRTPDYLAELRRLGPRMRNAQVIIRDHPGGYLIGTIADVEDINALGLPVRIVGRSCLSACTLFLGARDVCVSPRTSFGFHQPGAAKGRGPIDQGTLDAAIRRAADMYRPGLRDWWLERGSRSKRLVHLSGRELARFGYRLC